MVRALIPAQGSTLGLLQLKGPPVVDFGTPFKVYVTNGETRKGVEGATVGGSTTSAKGEASITYTTLGLKILKAERVGYVRSDQLRVLVI